MKETNKHVYTYIPLCPQWIHALVEWARPKQVTSLPTLWGKQAPLPICPHPLLLPACHHRSGWSPTPGLRPLSRSWESCPLLSHTVLYNLSNGSFPPAKSLPSDSRKRRERECRLVWKEQENTLVRPPHGDCYSQCVTVRTFLNPGAAGASGSGGPASTPPRALEQGLLVSITGSPGAGWPHGRQSPSELARQADQKPESHPRHPPVTAPTQLPS